MASSNNSCPFILRFSKSMYKPNPKMGRGGKTRIADGDKPNPYHFVNNIDKGYKFYKSFNYNKDLPIFNKLILKQGSLSKSLRYQFLTSTQIKTIGSVSPEQLIFKLDNKQELDRISNIMRFSRNKSFHASFSHIQYIDSLLPEDKIRLSSFDISEYTGENFYISIFQTTKYYNQICNFIGYQLNLRQSDIITINDNLFIKIKTKDIKLVFDKLMTHSLIKCVTPEPEIVLHEQYARHNDLTLDCILPRDYNLEYPKVAIIDSGISDSSYLKEWEIGTETFINDSDKNPRHGTFVCGRLLSTEDQFGEITFLNVEIIPAKSPLTIDVFYKNMQNLLEKHSKSIKIYNISLGTNLIVTDQFSLPAHMLDTLQKEYDVLFIISAGNVQPDQDTDTRITSPAESVHSITVGSVSHIETNMQKLHSPSLFTRHGPGSASFIKPDLSSYGGSHEKKFGKLKPVGVFSIGIRNELAEDSGTSHATPLVASMAAKIYHQYSHAFKSPNMTKALIIHNTCLLNCTNKIDDFSGYGVMQTDDNSSHSVTYLHEGTAIHGRMVELPEIPVPDDMFENGKLNGHIQLTIVYKTPTDINYPHYYCMCNLEASLGYYKNDKWTAILTPKDTLGMPDSFRNDYKTTQERFKWQPTKVMSRYLKNKEIAKKLSLRIIPTKRDFYTENENINYAIIISFTHREKNLYQCLRKRYSDFEYILEPASNMWKTCG